MIRNLIFVLLCFSLLCATAYAQPAIPKDVDALRKKLRESKADTNRVKLLIDLCRYHNAASAQHPALADSALATANKALALASKLDYPEGIGLSYQVMAQTWCNKKDFKKSDELIKKAINIFLANNLHRDAAEAYLNMEEFYLSAGGKDYKVMIGYYEQARPLFHGAKAFDREGATLTILGDFYQCINDYDNALARLYEALAAYKKTNYVYLQYTYDLLNSVNSDKSRYNEALKYGLLAAKTAEELKDTSMMACTIYNRLGITYFLVNKVDQSRIYFEKALDIAKKYKDNQSIRIVLKGLVEVLLSEKKPAEALTLLKNIQKNFPANDSGSIKWRYATYIGIYSDMKNYPLAQQYADSLLTTNILTRENVFTIYGLDALTNYLIESSQYQQASKFLPQFQRLASTFSMKREEYSAYLRGFKADSAQKKYISAIDNYRKYFLLKDSIYDVEKTGQVEELKIKYETEQKEKSITGLKKDSLLQLEAIKRADNVRNVTIIALIILSIFIVLLYKSFRINKQNTEAIQKKNEALNQLITEKEWLLKEIHHRVKNNLQIITGLLQRQSAYINNDEALAAIQNSENRMHSIALIHQKLYQSESLDLICMTEYIDEMISYLKDSCALDNRILFEKHIEEIYLDVAQAVPLGLILNEAITNAIKYAYKADENGTIYITFVNNKDQWNQLTIADNGPGLPNDFDVDRVESLGINLMRGLAKQLGGSFEITSDEGCTININFKTEIFGKSLS